MSGLPTSRTAVVTAVCAGLWLSASSAKAQETEKKEALEEIVVTGSRIAHTDRDYGADSPIITMKGDDLANASQPTVDNLLQRMPQFTGSSGGTGQNATTAGNGIATLNLRNLGDNRNGGGARQRHRSLRQRTALHRRLRQQRRQPESGQGAGALCGPDLRLYG